MSNRCADKGEGKPIKVDQIGKTIERQIGFLETDLTIIAQNVDVVRRVLLPAEHLHEEWREEHNEDQGHDAKWE